MVLPAGADAVGAMGVIVILVVLIGLAVAVRMVVIVIMLMAVALLSALLQVHVKVKGVDSALLRPSKVQVIAVHLQALQPPLQPFPAGAQVQKGAHRHISADS